MLAQEVPVYASQPDIQSGDISLEETDENGISEEPVEEVLEEPVEEAAEEVVEEADEAYMSSELLGEVESYTVKFNANNGTSESNTQKFIIGEPQQLNTNKFTKTGYKFDSWNTDEDGQGDTYTNGEMIVAEIGPAGSTVNLYAQWKAQTYDVFFDANGGKCTKTESTVTYDQKYGVLPVPTKDNYTFLGWFTELNGGTQIKESDQVQITDALSLYAHWIGNKYTIKFDAAGGECDTTIMDVTYDQLYGTLPVPTRENYTFLGWYTESVYGNEITADDKVKITKDRTLYAHWRGVTVKVILHPNDPDDPENVESEGVILTPREKTVYFMGTYETLPKPEKAKYRFLGWYTKKEGGNRIIASSTVADNKEHTLYAHWLKKEYKITFNPNGGTFQTEKYKTDEEGKYYKIVGYQEKYGDLPKENDDITNTGYTLDGWFVGYGNSEQITEDTDVTITANQILYAHWRGVSKTVTLNPVGGTVSSETVTVTYAGKYMLPTPEKEGNSFLGWFTEETGGTQVRTGDEARLLTDITLYAHWKALTYYAFYNANGGELKEQGKNVTFGQAYGTLPTPTREGYGFGGWYVGENLVNADTKVSTAGSHTLVAHWNSNNPTIYFDGNGGTVPAGEESKTVTYAEPYGELPEATRQCYDFTGWFTEAEGGEEITADSIVDVASAQTLYAHWTGKEYTISFNGNGGTCFPVTKKVYYDATYGTLPTASRTGHHFTGWFTEAEGGEEVKADTVVSTDNLDPEASEHKLFAHWEAAEYTVSFRPNGGTVPVGKESKTVTFGQPYGELPEPTRTGNNFGGWYLGNPETGTLVEATTTVATGADHDLTAKWLGRPYTVTFDVNGGDELPEEERTKTVYYKENYGSLPVPSREGFDFKGWYTGSEGGNQINPTTKVSVDADHTIYAKWSAIRCKVDFYANGGNWNGSPTRKLDTDWNTKFDTDRLIAPKYKKHAFTDWYKDPECTELFDFDQVIKTDVKIYAGWEELHLSGFDIKGLEGPFYYTGKAIKPVVTVYDYDHDYDIPLVSGKDYTLSFKNNTNAGIATVTVKGKGNYSGTQSKDFQIIAKDITGDEFAAEDVYLEYSGKGRRPAPTLTKNGRALKANKEYKLYWVNEEGVEGGLIKAPGTYPIKITGYGNYTGERIIDYVIIERSERLISKAWANAANREYDGTPAEPKVRVSWEGNPLTVDEDYYILWPGQNVSSDPIDFDVMTNAGTVTIRIVGKGRYVGVKKATYRILGQTILTSWIMGMAAKYEYTGGEIQPLGAADNDESLGTAAIYAPNGYKLVKGTDYTIKYTKDIVNAGEVTVTVTGKGRFQGTVSKTYKIVAAPINVLTYTKPEGVDTISVKYEKGGNEPRLQGVRINGSLAVEGRDYTLAFKNNKKVGQASMIFTGCGNFKGKYTVPFNIVRQELGDVAAVHIILSDAPNGGKPGGHEITPILRDLRTNQLLDSKDYSQKIRYLYVKSMEVTNRINKTEIKVKRFAGRPVEPGDIVPVGAELNVEIDGAGNFSGTAKAGKIKVKARDLGREKVVIYDKYYNGSAVTLTKDDIVFRGGTLMPPTKDDYNIVGYANNTAKGTATVILKGTGETFGGIKKVNFKIKQRTVIFP